MKEGCVSFDLSNTNEVANPKNQSKRNQLSNSCRTNQLKSNFPEEPLISLGGFLFLVLSRFVSRDRATDAGRRDEFDTRFKVICLWIFFFAVIRCVIAHPLRGRVKQSVFARNKSSYLPRMKVFSTRIIPAPGREMLEKAGVTLIEWKEQRDLSPEELIAHCQDADALMSAGPNKIDQAFLTASAHLKIISLLSVGYDNVDVDACARLGIAVGNTPGVLSAATADTAFLLMVATSRQAFYMHRKVVDGTWGFYEPTDHLGIELHGKTLGVFGLGNIGLEMALRSKGAYGMKIIYHNRKANPDAEKVSGAELVPMDRLLAESDVLTVHTALTPETRGFFNLEKFRLMKPMAIFVNTARGAIHVEADLTQAIESGLIWGAGLDVTDPEPMPADSPLLRLPTVCVLPHIGSATVETRDAMSVLAANNILAVFAGKNPPHAVLPKPA